MKSNCKSRKIIKTSTRLSWPVLTLSILSEEPSEGSSAQGEAIALFAQHGPRGPFGGNDCKRRRQAASVSKQSETKTTGPFRPPNTFRKVQTSGDSPSQSSPNMPRLSDHSVMTASPTMDTYAARLASFNATHSPKKKRPSEVRSAKTVRWPYKMPSPPQACLYISRMLHNSDMYVACKSGLLLPPFG